jgi:hypothetical protein
MSGAILEISSELLEYLDELGEQTPVTRHHILKYMPTVHEVRSVVPAVMSTAELKWAIDHAEYQGMDDFPETRIRFMLYVNHYVRVRTDPGFLRSESAIAHRQLGHPYNRLLAEEVRDMEYAAESIKDNPSSIITADFLVWYERVKDTPFRIGPDGLPIVGWCNKRRRWHSTYYPTDDKDLAYTKTPALIHAREQFRLDYLSIMSEG